MYSARTSNSVERSSVARLQYAFGNALNPGSSPTSTFWRRMVLDATRSRHPPITTRFLLHCVCSDHHHRYKVMDIVHNASADELRAVVLALCQDSSVCIQIETHLRKIRDARADVSKTGEKRKASDQFFICVRCDESFSEETNHSKACTYHHGKCASKGKAGPYPC